MFFVFALLLQPALAHDACAIQLQRGDHFIFQYINELKPNLRTLIEFGENHVAVVGDSGKDHLIELNQIVIESIKPAAAPHGDKKSQPLFAAFELSQKNNWPISFRTLIDHGYEARVGVIKYVFFDKMHKPAFVTQDGFAQYFENVDTNSFYLHQKMISFTLLSEVYEKLADPLSLPHHVTLTYKTEPHKLIQIQGENLGVFDPRDPEDLDEAFDDIEDPHQLFVRILKDNGEKVDISLYSVITDSILTLEPKPLKDSSFEQAVIDFLNSCLLSHRKVEIEVNGAFAVVKKIARGANSKVFVMTNTDQHIGLNSLRLNQIRVADESH